MNTSHKNITALQITQIAYPVGINKDSYSISSYFKQDVETLEITVTHELIKNWISNNKVILFIGTYKECIKFFMDNVMNTEKEWIRDDKHKYIYPTE